MSEFKRKLFIFCIFFVLAMFVMIFVDNLYQKEMEEQILVENEYNSDEIEEMGKDIKIMGY